MVSDNTRSGEEDTDGWDTFSDKSTFSLYVPPKPLIAKRPKRKVDVAFEKLNETLRSAGFVIITEVEPSVKEKIGKIIELKEEAAKLKSVMEREEAEIRNLERELTKNLQETERIEWDINYFVDNIINSDT